MTRQRSTGKLDPIKHIQQQISTKVFTKYSGLKHLPTMTAYLLQDVYKTINCT